MKKRLIQIAVLGLLGFSVGWAFGQTPHTATYTISSTQCTTDSPCTAAIYRVVIPSGTCPAAWDAKYIQVQSNLPGSTITSTGTTWNYVDSGSTLVSGATYCGYSTVANGGGPSQASAVFQGQIPTPPVIPLPPIIKVILK